MPRVRLAAYYFAVFLGLGAVLPFLPLLLSSRGMSASMVGVVLVIGPVANLVAPPLWAWLADTFGVRALLLSIASAGCALGVVLLIPDWGLLAAFGAMAIYSICRSPIAPLADAAAHAELGEDGPRFARIRVWGSIGFAVAAATLGELEASTRPLLLFGVAAVAHVLGAAIASRRRAPWQPRQTGVALRALAESRAHGLGALFLGSALYYFAHGSYDAFMALHLKALGHGDALVGLAWAVGVSCEIALMMVATTILRRVAAVNLLVVGAVASVVRWSLMSWVVSAAAIVAVQTLHALTFGLWYLAMVGYVQSRATESLRTIIQSLAHASLAVGMIGGYVIGGAVFDRLGGAMLFRLGALAAAGAAVAYGALARRERLRSAVPS